VEFGDRFAPEKVGILTGDTKENAEAPIIVGTTEILRNQLYDAMEKGENLPFDLVIIDEAHYLGDRQRGVVWEEILIYLPTRINILLLSATIGNGEEIAGWLSSLRGKECVVIKEEKRPVPLFPLFLHPAGKILPLLEEKKLHREVVRLLEVKKRPFRTPPPRFGKIIEVLEKYNLLPAIFFLKSRAECDAALLSCHPGEEISRKEDFLRDLEQFLADYPFLRTHKQLAYLKYARVASHHGGQLPLWKFLVEKMMKLGHLRAIFATSTVAAGVNYPARTIVLFNSDLYNGSDFSPLNSTEFHQMMGRAGRRGRDKIGFLLAVPGRFMDLKHLRKLFFARPENIESQLRSDFSMVLNLLLSQRPENIKEMLTHSFYAYQFGANEKRRKRIGQKLWKDWERHLAFLRAEGFVDDEDRLTESGIWASKLRLDHPLLIAECLKQDAFPREDEKLLAALVAPFVYDGNTEIKFKRSFRPLREAYRRIINVVQPLMMRMAKAGFPTQPLFFWPCAVIYDWARGRSWEEIIAITGLTDGDLAMLILRTADNLRQLASLKDSHPDTALLALRARESILREPVIFE